MQKSFWPLLCLLCCLAHADEGWKFSSDRKGVVVYKKPIDPSGIVPFKAVTTVPHPLLKVAAVMNDTHRRPEWAKRLYGVKIIKDAGPYERTEYFRIRTPFVMWDRDFVVWYKVNVLKGGKELLVNAKSIEHKGHPEQPKIVRGNVISGEMRLFDLGDKTKISMVTYLNPNGSVPKWIVNLFTEGISRKMIQLMVKQIEKDLYGQKELNEIAYFIKNYHKESKAPVQ